jgi:hypothetical protein
MKPKGYMGKVLEVDLSSKHMKVIELDEEILYKNIGARGLGIRLLTDLTAAQIHPLSPQNPLIFMTGPYNGTGVFSAFFNVTTKAPLTGISGSSHCGGKWGPQLKRAGFDGVVVKGAAQSSCYLLIEEGNATLLAGGVQGENRLGGNSLLDVLVFGRIAGKNAASYAREGAKEGRLTLDHVRKFHDETRKMGIDRKKISSILLQDYSNPLVRKRQLNAHYQGTIR